MLVMFVLRLIMVIAALKNITHPFEGIIVFLVVFFTAFISIATTIFQVMLMYKDWKAYLLSNNRS